MKLRSIAGAAVLAGGLAGFATPAYAATGPTVTVEGGTAIVTGTPDRDRLIIDMNNTGLSIDIGDDGTVDVQVARSRYQQVRVLLAEGADSITLRGLIHAPVTINGDAGNDVIAAFGSTGGFPATDAPTTYDGGAGNDFFIVSTAGPATIRAGAGDDFVEADSGADNKFISLGEGNDRVQSTLDTIFGNLTEFIDGGEGRDLIDMEGTFAAESVGLSATKGQLLVTYFLQSRLAADNVEDVTFIGFGGLDVGGGGDAVAVNDLTTTDVVRFTPNFGTVRGGTDPNNSADTLTVRGTPGVDRITVSGAKSNILVAGLNPVVDAVALDAQDFLLIDTLAGNDIVDSSGLQPGLVQLLVR